MYQSSNKTIAKNTLFLFFRTLLVMGISLYTSRVVLAVLGVEDFGIYNVVGGVVSMLEFLNSAMVQASQRYLSFAQGTNNLDNQKKVFSTSILIHATIALIVVFLLETIGLWYVNNKVILPSNRLYAANIIYQISILVFLSRILVVPYNASVIAHEKMNVYAYISIADYILQLGLVLLLKTILYDKLIVFGAMMFLVACLHYILYVIYSKHKFVECKFHWYNDKSLYKEMFSFASWAFLGGAGFIARNQGVNLVINLFCGPAVNAARGVAYQVSAAIQTLIASFQQSMNPQITKRYASGDLESMMLLVRAGSKFSFLLLLICFAPIIVRPEYILRLWLGNVPEYAAEFLVMAVIMSLVTSMDGTLNTAMQATGDIKVFQVVVSVIMICDIPSAYYLLTLGIEPYLVTGVSVFTAILCLLAKLIILRKHIKYNLLDFLMSIVCRNFIISIIVFILFFGISHYVGDSFLGFCVLYILSIILNGLIILFLGFNTSERRFILSMIDNAILKFKQKVL